MPSSAARGCAMGKHTPAPWHERGGVVTDAAGVAIADCTMRWRSPLGGEAEANARLISAAPELLALTEALLGVHVSHDPTHREGCQLCSYAAHVLGQARGEVAHG